MAIQTVTIGSMATVHQYDDGGIAAGVRCSAPIASAAPVNADECLRLGDLPTIANLITSTNVIADHAAVRGDGGARIVQDSSLIINDTGQLGIGVNPPTYDLHVVGADPTVFLQDSTNTCQAFMRAGDTIARVGSVSNHDFRIQSNSTDRIWVDNGGVVSIGGAVANSVTIATDGQLTLLGTARVHRYIRVSAPSFAPGATAPTASRLSVFPTYIFAVNDDVHYSLICPFRMEAGSVIDVFVDFTHRDAVDTGTAEWQLEYRCVQANNAEDVTGATSTIAGTSGATAQHELTRVQLATGITGAVAGDVIGMILKHIGGGTIGVNVDLVQVHFHLTMDKLGEPT